MKHFDDGCGGFGMAKGLPALEKLYRAMADQKIKWQPSYNIRPASIDPVITMNSPRKIVLMKWGLVPFWYKGDPKRVMFGNINARSETVEVKPYFRDPFKHHRCIVPCEYFMEFAINAEDPKIKEPYLFRSKTQETLSLAGLYDIWKDVEGRKMLTFTILTCEPNKTVGRIHSRMPVCLEVKDLDTWMDNSSYDLAKLKSLCKPYPDKDMLATHVGREINNSRNDGIELVKPIPEVPISQSKPAWQS